MATSQERNPYGALGAGGKFRKKSYRRPQSTPYDRPPTAIRNPTIVPGAVGDSWLRKLMDPAHKLLAATAHRFYTSLFRKRLTQPPPPPPPPPQPPEAKQEAGEKHEAPFPLNILKEQEAASSGNLSLGPREGSSSMDLEEILKQRTFTRSEIDRLMALLCNRAVDNPVQVEERTPDVLHSRSGVFHEQIEEVAKTPLQENGNGGHLIHSKAINSSVPEEDIASPAELAKAYMGSRPSKVSPSVLGLHSRAVAEDSAVPGSLAHSSKSPILSLVPSSSGHVGVRENGYTTPRSRGRSAIYSMARTPYSRGHVTNTLKSYGPIIDVCDGPSSSIQAAEHGRSSGSTKALKRSSSIFENDISSGGPLRRIRQKPNLSYRRSWILPSPADAEPSSSTKKMQSVNERKISFAEQSNVAPVSSKSTDMASKILQQLDKIVSPPKERSSELKLAVAREKAPAQLSPSKLQGQALKSLEHIDSSKFLEFGRENKKADDAVARSSHYSGETSKGNQDKVEQNGPLSVFAASDKLSPSVNVFENAVPVGRTGEANLSNSLTHVPVQNKRAFKMSAHEDYLDLEDDDYSDGPSSSLVGVREKQDIGIVEPSPSATQATSISDKHKTVTEDQHRVNFFTKEINNQAANGKQVVAETQADIRFPIVLASSTSSQSDPLVTRTSLEPDKALLPKEPNGLPSLFSSGDKIGAPKDHSAPSLIFGFSSNDVFSTGDADKTPQPKFDTSSPVELSSKRTLPDTRAQSSSSDAPVAGGLFGTTEKVPESDKAEEKKPLKDVASSGVPDGSTVASVSTTSSATVTFGIKSANSNNETAVSAPISADSKTTEGQKPFTIPSFPVAFSGNNSSSDLSSTITATTPNPAFLTFGFGSSPSNLVSQASSPNAVASEDAKTKENTVSGNIIGNSFVAANSSPGSSVFGLVATSATSNGSNQKESSAITDAANGPARVPESPAVGAGPASFTENNVPIQFGSSFSSRPSTTVAASTSSSLFGSSSAAKLFSSETSFGSGKESSTEPSSFNPSSSSLFGQATTAPAFAPSMASKSLSTGFSFGSSSSSSSSFVFGSAPSSSSPSSSASVFGLSGTSPVFGSIGTSSTSTVTPVFGSTGVPSASTAAAVFGSISTSSAATGASVFGSNMASSTSSPFFGSMGASSAPTFLFNAASANPSSGPTFSITSAAASPSPPPAFGSSNSPFTFGSPAPAGNNNSDQMSMEDSMAEDTVQANHSSMLPAPAFGQQQPIAPPAAAGFMFGPNVAAAAGANTFQFGAQTNPSTPQSSSPFQASGSLDFNAGGGSFSLGTGGGDKSGRKIVKINRNKQRRK